MLTFEGIEHNRRRQDISSATLCRMAGLPYSTWWRIAKGERTPRPATLQKLQDALDGKARRRLVTEGELITEAYRGYLALFAVKLGGDAMMAISADPHHHETSAKNGNGNGNGWAEAARFRAIAVYCVVVGLNINGARVARAIGLSKQAVSLMLHKVEDWRDENAAVDRAIEEIAHMRGRRHEPE
jgi:transcriptional regulator with XRE-family HTH domain